MKYKFETHAHTAESSPCARVKAADLVKLYHENGYKGMVITDHIAKWSFDYKKGCWEDKIDELLNSYHRAKKAGQKLGMSVLLGVEVSIGNPARDYLVYGIGGGFLHGVEVYNGNPRQKIITLAHWHGRKKRI